MIPLPARPAQRPPLHRMGTALLAACVCLLAGACTFPRKDFSSLPDASVIGLAQEGRQLRAVAPECSRFLSRSQLSKPGDTRMDIAFGCATYTNLSAQIAQPADLFQPRPFGGQEAGAAGAAVERYRMDAVKPLRGTTTTDAGTP